MGCPLTQQNIVLNDCAAPHEQWYDASRASTARGAAAQEACRFCPLDPAVAAPACSTSVSGCTGSRRAASDAEADAIKHCTVISGTLTIQSFTLTATGLEKLLNLERVCGDVAIQELRVGGALTGLDSLEYVGGNLTMGKMPGTAGSDDYLTSLDALSSLRYVGGALKVKKNCHIESLANSVLHGFEHAVIGDPGASVVEYYVERLGLCRRLRASRHAGLRDLLGHVTWARNVRSQ